MTEDRSAACCSSCSPRVGAPRSFYEIVWYQLLEFAIGSTAVSLGVLLATFMGGLCLGSFALPRVFARRRYHPLRVYALIELGIGVCGLLVRVAIPLADRVYVAAMGYGMPAILLRAAICAVCLLPPTLLMGASLPAVARWVQATPRGVSWLGFLYGANTAGAVLGCLIAGFYLLRVFNMTVATLVAVLLNIAVACASWALAYRASCRSRRTQFRAHPPRADADTTRVPHTWPVYLAIALSGASALGAEVVWTRLLGLLLGATVYTLSIILAVFLGGLGIGSAAGSMLLRRVGSRAALGYCQLLLAAAIAWTAFMATASIPYWPVNAFLSSAPWLTFQIDLVRVIWAIFPATLLWGASFPLALAAAAQPGDDPGRLAGGIYAANTSGAIVGALAFSMVLIPWIGTQHSERVLIAMAALAALVVLAPLAWGSRSAASALLLAGAMVDRRCTRRHRAWRAAGAGRVWAAVHHELTIADACCTWAKGSTRRSPSPSRPAARPSSASAATAKPVPHLRHAATALARPPRRPGASRSAIGARRGVRRGRDRRELRPLPERAAHRDLRAGAARSASDHANTSRRRTTTCCTTRAPTSSTTTRGTSS